MVGTSGGAPEMLVGARELKTVNIGVLKVFFKTVRLLASSSAAVREVGATKRDEGGVLV